MQATVAADNTVRTIRLTVHNVPDIDVTMSYHRKPRIFRPEHATVRLVDGEIGTVVVSGGLVLKSGAASDLVSESVTYYGVKELDKAPEWVRVIAAEAPHGVTTWRTGADAGEVQAL